MDAVAQEQNKSIEDWMRNESMGGGSALSGRRRGVGGVHKGNRAAACLVAMIINQQRNNVI